MSLQNKTSTKIPPHPYPDAKPGEADAKRLSVDVPLFVHSRIRDCIPYRGFWKLFLSLSIQQYDQYLQKYKITTLTYPVQQQAALLLMNHLTAAGGFDEPSFELELDTLIFESRPRLAEKDHE